MTSYFSQPIRVANISRLLLLTGLLWLLAGCSSVKVTDYQHFEPLLEPEKFFDGELSAHGVVKNRSGRVIRSFNATIDASWNNGIGTLDERFLFDDGEQQRRVWTLTPDGDGRYIGEAGDVIGKPQLQVSGNSLFMKYRLRIPYRDGSIDVDVDDRMYLVAPDVLLNESAMSKFGVNVGSLQLVILRR